MVTSDGAPAMIGHYRGFFVFLKEKVPTVHTAHCVLHRQYPVANKLSDTLLGALKVLIKSIDEINAYPLYSRLFTK